MIIKRMAICLGMAAICALSASSASAAEFHLPTLTGTQTTSHVFTTSAGTVTCNIIDSAGAASGTTSQITLKPTYSQCKAFGFINVPIHTNGCHYLVTADGQMHIQCPGAAAVEITAPGCITKFGTQTVGKTTFESNEAKTDITMTSSITGITYDECGTIRSNGTYTGKTTLTATTGLWVDPPPPLTGEFHMAKSPIYVTAAQTTTHKFILDGGNIECKNYVLAGASTFTTTKSLTLAMQGESCIAFGFLNVPTHENGCAYILDSSGTSQLECPTGKSIETTVHPECLVKIGPQHFSSGNNFSNNVGKTDFSIISNTTGITYTECGTVRANGKTTGTITVTGETPGGEPVNIWYE